MLFVVFPVIGIVMSVIGIVKGGEDAKAGVLMLIFIIVIMFFIYRSFFKNSNYGEPTDTSCI